MRRKSGFTNESIIIISSIIISLTILSLVIAYIAKINIIQQNLITIQKRLLSQTTLRAAPFRETLNNLHNDVLFLSGTPPVSGIVRADLNHGYDSQEKSSIESWKKRLSTIFIMYLKTHPETFQLQFIKVGEKSKEIIRVDKQNGQIVPSIGNAPQNKYTNDFIKQVLQLKMGDVYLSDIHLNREYGKITRPYKPTIHAATPIYSESGNLFGIIIIDYNISDELKGVGKNITPGFSVYVVNEDGDYLSNPDSRLTFGFDLQMPHRWQDEFVKVTPESSIPSLYTFQNPRLGKVYSAHLNITLDEKTNKRKISIIMTASDKLIQAQVIKMYWVVFWLNLLSIIIVIIMFYFYKLFHEKIGREQAHLAAIVGNSTDAIISKTLKGVITSWNNAAEKLFGYSAKEAIGKNIINLLIPSELHYEEINILQKIKTGKSILNFETQRLHKDGHTLDVSLNISPIKDEFGHIIGISKTARDITEQKLIREKIRRNEEMLSQAMNMSPSAIIVADRSGVIKRVNRMAETLLGYQIDELIGQNVDSLVPNNLLLNHKQLRERWFQEGAKMRPMGKGRDLHVKHHNGTLIPVEINLGSIQLENESLVQIVFNDISERLLTKTTLENQVKERTYEIEKAMRLQTAILNNAGSAIIATDANGLITLFNSTAEAMLGYGANEIMGKQTPAFFHEPEEIVKRTYEFSQELKIHFEPGFKTFVIKSDLGLFNQHVWTYIRKNGERLQVLLTITALRDMQNNIKGYLGIAIDISQREKDKQELQSLTEQLKTAAQVAELGVWTWNVLTGEIIWNEKMFELYQAPNSLKKKKLYFDYWRDSVHPEDIKETEDKLEAALKGGEKFDVVFRIVLKKGKIRYIHAVATVEYDAYQHPIHMMGINRDITKQREYENFLYTAKQAADAASKAKSNFLANMSHEIRTPMNAILGMLQLLMQTHLDKRQADYVNQVDSAAKTLLGILNDILDFSKIEAGKLELDIHPTDINKVLTDIGIIFSASLGKKNIEVLFDIDPKLPKLIMTDSLRLKQILVNLGGNAIKFTEQGEVLISASIVNKNFIKISVKDTGIGISQKQQKYIFEGFSQAEASTARRFGGTGLGLSICQRLIKLMGSTLEVKSKLGKGSEFSFVLPLQLAKEQNIKQIAHKLNDLHVLLVDDNESARQVIGKMLKNLGWVYDEASSGYDAIKLIKQKKHYDVIFIDWKMPTMDGWVTSQRIRSIIHNHAPVIIMTTALGLEAITEQNKENSGLLNGFLVKPFTSSSLFDAVSEARLTEIEKKQIVESPKNRSLSLAGIRTLLVEDNKANQFVAHELLKSEGAEVEIVDDGVAAIKQLRANPKAFDVVLMDVQMPDMDGYMATHEIRERLGLKELPIIAMTANVMEVDRMAALASGMNDHIPKPIDLDTLVKTILRCTGREVNIGKDKTVKTKLTATNTEYLMIADAIERFGGNQTIYEKALDLFVKDTPGMVSKIAQMITNHEYDQIRTILHTLKGVASNVGAMKLAKLAADLEHKDPDEINPKIADLENELQHTIHAAQTILAKTVASHCDKKHSMKQWREDMRELLSLLSSSNMKAIICSEKIRQQYSWLGSDKFNAVNDLVNRLAFKEAADLCRKLLEKNKE